MARPQRIAGQLMARCAARAAVVFIELAATLVCAHAAPTCRVPTSLPILPGVILNGERQRLYVVGSDNALESIAAPSGAVLGRDGLSQPLAFARARLLVWARADIGISLEWLDVDGAEMRPVGGIVVPLPDWAKHAAAQISVAARLTGCTLLVSWKAIRRAARGGFGPTTRPDLSAAGWIEVDVEENHFGIVERAPEVNDGRVSVPYRQGLEWRATALEIGQDTTAALRRRSGGPSEELALVIRQGSTERELVVGRGIDLLAMVSLDARYLFVGDIGGPSNGGERQWSVIELTTLMQVATVVLPAGVLSANVSEGRLYYLRETVTSSGSMGNLRRGILVAADLSSGRVLWEHLLQQDQQPLLPPASRP